MSDTPFTVSAGAPSQSEIVPHVRRPVPGTEADSRKLLAYWNALRVNLDVPRRCDVDPRGIAGILSRTFILERVAPGLARFRVAGTHLSDLLGMDVRGMPVSAMFQPKGRPDLAESLEQVFETPGILRAALVSPGGFRQPEINAELLVLPLRDNDGQVTRAIGCLLAKSQIGKAPRRFEFRHVRVDPVTVVKAPEQKPTKRLFGLSRAPRADASGDAAVIAPKFEPLKAGQPSYLRVVAND